MDDGLGKLKKHFWNNIKMERINWEKRWIALVLKKKYFNGGIH